jgi:two-component system sensor histidine kinase/response regulator
VSPRIAFSALALTILLTLASFVVLPLGVEMAGRLVGLLVLGAALATLVTRRTRSPSRTMIAIEREVARITREEAAAVTKRNEASLRIEGRHRVREAFIAAVSHELRTPLNAILGFTLVLLEELDGPLNGVQREDVTAIHDAGAHLRALVEEVIDTSARRSVETAPIDRVELEPLVREIGRALEAQLRGRPMTLRIVLGENLPTPIGDARRIRQILWNLGTNAVKYTDRGEIVISVRRDGGDVRFSVRDTGRGIAKADLDRIFADHERVEPTVEVEPRGRRRSEGWGLGLAIAREMAIFHGGRIEVESAVGKGSTFHFVMPVLGEPT